LRNLKRDIHKTRDHALADAEGFQRRLARRNKAETRSQASGALHRTAISMAL
jgi:hypothetical protein